MKIPQVDPATEKSLNTLLWLVAVGFFMQTLDATIVNTALPAMAEREKGFLLPFLHW